MNNSLSSIVFIVVFAFAGVDELKAQKGYIEIQQDSTISKLMTTKIEIDTENYASKFYTIQLFYGDNKRAQELYDNFKETFPDWEVNLSFETPNYKVQVGRYKDYYSGLNKLNEVKRNYPAAFLLEIKD
ncbi:MAG: hypothetical protein CBC02_011375 [Flavobacteriaceae bacterium TMED42]|nr:MAG: hypothetical protein CBC02_011375 [Flavobacteriaceae bacterium TMED42]|tara:strand:- start:2941 stop:3327 length:387 start_codon:yes stop_codon:yes gene_type:complete